MKCFLVREDKRQRSSWDGTAGVEAKRVGVSYNRAALHKRTPSMLGVWKENMCESPTTTGHHQRPWILDKIVSSLEPAEAFCLVPIRLIR